MRRPLLVSGCRTFQRCTHQTFVLPVRIVERQGGCGVLTDTVWAEVSPVHERPDLFLTLDHRSFLTHWFAYKKAVNPRFSHRVFARLAGVKSSSLLLLVMQGKRNLSPPVVTGVCKAMGLDAEEEEYFAALVELDAASDPDDKSRIFARVSGMRRFQAARRIEGEGFRYLSVWYLPAIRELALLDAFVADPDWIASALRPPIRPEQAAEGLALLQSMGLLAPDAGGRLRPVDQSVVTPHEVAGLAVRNYHLGMLARATEAIGSFSSAERHLGAVTVAVPAAMVPRLKREIAAFQEHVLDMAEAHAAEGELVVQVNLQLFPLSGTFARSTP
jgi:uncharacterized protein (TIGR02147 family)